jgi:arginase
VTRHYAIVEAPSVLGLRPTGVERLPDALIGAGLDVRLRARLAARVEPPPYDDRRDPETLMLNAQGIADYTPNPPPPGTDCQLATFTGRVVLTKG